MSRYTRDEICLQAIDLMHSPTIKSHDANGDVLDQNAWTLKWLQNGLDLLHRLYPFSGDVNEVSMTFPAGSSNIMLQVPASHSVYVPDDFVVDVRNGLFTTYSSREYNLARSDYQRFQKRRMLYQSTPSPMPLIYCIVKKQFRVLPVPTQNLAGTLHYFALPTVPGPGDFVDFPDEYTLIEFIRLKGLEWTRTPGVPFGAAQTYLTEQLGKLRSSGLLNSPEYEDGIPLENEQVINEYNVSNRNAWMGAYAV